MTARRPSAWLDMLPELPHKRRIGDCCKFDELLQKAKQETWKALNTDA